jgi:iron complex outermembrane receptor protein
MKSFVSLALAGVSTLAISTAASAQTAPAQPAAAPAEEVSLGEIVVTARRRSESLQEVPQTVNAVTSDTLQKLNITQFQDVQTIVPGLSLAPASTGYAQNVSLRGVSFDVNTAAPLGTVAFYINDAPVQSGYLFNSLFDVGQIEVLRGPQGTTRGVSAPSGAITITTHKPNLSEFGGYVNGTLTDLQGRNLQGAINVPIIQDVLAVRVAGLIDQNDADGVRSIHNSVRPTVKTTAERVSVSFEPSDVFNANVTWLHLDKRSQTFDQVSGPGTPAYGSINPPISAFQRVAVEDGISDVRTHQDLITAQVDSRIFGQHLSYVGSYQFQKIHARNIGPTNSDMGNILPGIELYNYQDVPNTWTTQEIRLASDPAPGRFFDYTVGAFYNWQETTGDIVYPGNLLQGAFGNPLTGVNLAAYDPRYQIPLLLNIPSTNQETSLFASVTLHLDSKTELSGGIRHIWSVVNRDTVINVGNGLAAFPAAAFGGNCAALGFASTYPGTCDVPIPSAQTTHNPNRTSETPNIYNVSLSHHFSRDFMVYVNTGTSFRAGFQSVGLSGPQLESNDPAVQSLNNHPSERSRSYEIGFKSTLLDGRLRLNADVFRQRFSNFPIYVPNINTVSAQGPTQFAFTQSVDALVQGFEFDTALQVTRDWNVSLQASYSDGQVQGSMVPCNTYAADGVTPTFNQVSTSGVGFVSLCPGSSATRLPYWTATLTSEYVHPVRDGIDGFVRGLFTYTPENKNRMEQDFTVDSYGLLNLFAGLRSSDGAWEVSLFAKNALKNETLLDRSPVAQAINDKLGTPVIGFPGQFPTTSGYFATQITPRREVGVNVRYAWGSR